MLVWCTTLIQQFLPDFSQESKISIKCGKFFQKRFTTSTFLSPLLTKNEVPSNFLWVYPHLVVQILFRTMLGWLYHFSPSSYVTLFFLVSHKKTKFPSHLNKPLKKLFPSWSIMKKQQTYPSHLAAFTISNLPPTTPFLLPGHWGPCEHECCVHSIISYFQASSRCNEDLPIRCECTSTEEWLHGIVMEHPTLFGLTLIGEKKGFKGVSAFSNPKW